MEQIQLRVTKGSSYRESTALTLWMPVNSPAGKLDHIETVENTVKYTVVKQYQLNCFTKH